MLVISPSDNRQQKKEDHLRQQMVFFLRLRL
jgi:hypothetical protein